MTDKKIPDDLVEVGRIAEPYGVRGLIKVFSHSDQSDALFSAEQWYLRKFHADAQLAQKQPWEIVEIKTIREHGSSLVAQLDGLQDRDQAERYKNYSIFISRADFPQTEEDEFYWHDLIGNKVYGLDQAQNQVLLGEVLSMSDNGVHGVMHIAQVQATENGQYELVVDKKNRPIETLVPFVNAHVISVDLAQKQIITNWPADF